MNPNGRPSSSPTTALALRPVNYNGLARATLAQIGNHQTDFTEGAVLSWSLIGLTSFSLTPTILQALNRIRVLSGLEPLAMRDDGTIDLSDDPLLYQFAVAGPFAE